MTAVTFDFPCRCILGRYVKSQLQRWGSTQGVEATTTAYIHFTSKPAETHIILIDVAIEPLTIMSPGQLLAMNIASYGDDGIPLALHSIIASGANSAAMSRNFRVCGTCFFLEMVRNMRNIDLLVTKDAVSMLWLWLLNHSTPYYGSQNTPASPLFAVSTH